MKTGDDYIPLLGCLVNADLVIVLTRHSGALLRRPKRKTESGLAVEMPMEVVYEGRKLKI